MKHSFSYVYIHITWAVKYRAKIINPRIKTKLSVWITKNSQQKGIKCLAFSVQSDHVHVLISLRSDQRLQDIVQLLKGGSSYWINKEKLMDHKFTWQKGYAAFSINYRGLKSVIRYIHNQDRHHHYHSFWENLSDYYDSLEK